MEFLFGLLFVLAIVAILAKVYFYYKGEEEKAQKNAIQREVKKIVENNRALDRDALVRGVRRPTDD